MKHIVQTDRIGQNKPNQRKIWRSLFTLFFLLAGVAAFGQERENLSTNRLEDFNNSDLNQDQQWDREEFDTRMKKENLFEAWDANKDRQLSREELKEGLQREQNKRFEVKEQVIGNYAIVEVNEDDSVNLAGPATPRLNLDLIDDWDLDNDGTYSEAEMNTGLFDHWDEDTSGFLEYGEYSTTFFTEDYED